MMHAPAPAASDSPRPIVIDVAGQPVGVLVRQNRRYRFIAVKLPAFAIDGAEFDDPESARIAAIDAHARHGAVAAE